MADDQFYEVEKLLQKKVENKRVFYLVRWRNFPAEYDTWEPATNLTACSSLFKEFDRNQKISKSASVAAKLLKKSRAVSSSKGKSGTSKIISKNAKKPRRVSAKQKIAAELKFKSKKLAKLKLKAAAKRKQMQVKGKNVKKSVSKSHTLTSNSSKKSKSPSSNKKVKAETEKKARGTPAGTKRASQSPNSAKKELSAKKKAKQEAGDTPKGKGLETKKKTVTSAGDNKAGKKDTASKSESGKSSSIKKDTGKSQSIKSKSGSNADKIVDISTKGGKSSLKINHSSASRTYAKFKAATTNSEVTDSDFSIISDSESDVSDDDHILYSLTGRKTTNKIKNPVDGKGDTNDSVKSKDMNNRKTSSVKQNVGKESFGKNAQNSSNSETSSNLKRMSLMDFKKPKTSKQKSGPFDQLLRPSSPAPLFTPLKAVQSPLRGPLPNTTALNMDSLVGDVPVFPAAPAGPLSPSSISYKTLLDNLPSQLHPKGKAGKKKDNGNGASTSSGSSGGQSSGAFEMPEPIERRISVRAAECVFRYKQIVVKKCHRYTQIWLNTQTMMKNVFNPQVVQEVVAALNTAKYDDSSLVMFSSIGSFFCSGVDLHFLTTGDRRVAARQMADALRELTKAFITFPKPVIAGVGGSAVGLGVALLCLCDVVYSSDKAAFHLPYAQLSQTPEGCSSFTLPLALGLAAANELLFGGRRITAMEAYQLGLVSHVFWPTAFMQEVIPRAQNMASCSAKVLEGTKLLIRSHHRTKMELTNETECNLLLERWSSNECQRAMEAYLANENNFSS